MYSCKMLRGRYVECIADLEDIICRLRIHRLPFSELEDNTEKDYPACATNTPVSFVIRMSPFFSK